MENFIKKFIEEATDLINALEESVLSLEDRPEDKELINEVFRIMHSLKGSGAMFGFDKISDFTHNMENIYDEVRNSEKQITKKLLDITLHSVDHLRNLLNVNIAESKEVVQKHEELNRKIEEFLKSGRTEKQKTDTRINQQTTITSGEQFASYYIFFEPNSDIFDNGANPLYTVDDLYELGECKVFARTEKIPHLGKYDYSTCYIYWEIILQTSLDIYEIEDVFMFVEDDCKLKIQKISDTKIINNKNIIDALSKETKIDISKLKSFVTDIVVDNIVDEEKKVSDKIKKFKQESEITSIRIATEKIDQYINLVSELVSAHASLKLFSTKINNSELNEIAENIGNITEEIRDNAFNISLIPIENTIVRFRRLVRDLSAGFGKNIEFVTEGTDTRIDKTLLQIITEPLMHIIRNCVDHGIEKENERIALGKPPKGKIFLRAYHSGSNVHIEVSDDGKGIDINKVTKKAVERGLINFNVVLSKEDVKNMIFTPGFSTTDKVSDISGRGVGMDILKRKIAEARGDIDIDFEKNKGTKITLKIPITLAMIDGLLVKIGESLYIVQLMAISKITDIFYSELKKTKKNVAVIDGEQIPFYFMREEFEISGEYPEENKFLAIKYKNKNVGLVFDSVVGEYQTVLKSIGKLYKDHEMIAGATILGDGTVALVLDTNKLITKFSDKEQRIIRN